MTILLTGIACFYCFYVCKLVQSGIAFSLDFQKFLSCSVDKVCTSVNTQENNKNVGVYWRSWVQSDCSHLDAFSLLHSSISLRGIARPVSGFWNFFATHSPPFLMFWTCSRADFHIFPKFISMSSISDEGSRWGFDLWLWNIKLEIKLDGKVKGQKRRSNTN